jgi:hypothetical protein
VAITVPPNARGYVVSADLRSEDTPGEVSLRLFHFGGVVVDVRDVGIREVRTFGSVVKIAAWLFLAAVVLGAAFDCMRPMLRASATQIVRARMLPAFWATGIALVVVVGFIGVSMIGAPQIFADEYAYAATTVAAHTGNWTGLATAGARGAFPNRLFFALYQPAAGAVEPWIVARALNVAWLGIGAVLIAVAAYRAAVPASGLVVLLAFGLGPLASYTAYFMPETLFQVSFIAMCVSAVYLLDCASPWPAFAFGILGAALPLVRPHGWIGVVVAFLFLTWSAVARSDDRQGGGMRKLTIAMIAFTIASALFRVLLPDSPLRNSSLGSYSSFAAILRATIATPSLYPQMFGLFTLHIALVLTLTGPALPAGLCEAVRRRVPQGRTPCERFAANLAALAAITLIAYIALTAAFCVGMSLRGEPFLRLQSRYYGFALPLLVLGFLGSPTWRDWTSSRRALVLLIWAGACMATLLVLPQFFWTIVDTPELWISNVTTPVAATALGATGLAIAALMWRRAEGARTGVLVAYGFAAILSGVAARATQISWQELAEDRVARIAAALVRESDVPLVVVADLAKGDGWPFRIATYAAGRALFARPAAIAQTVAEVPPGTVIVGTTDQLPMQMLDVVAQFGRFTIARARTSHIDLPPSKP